MPDANVTTYSDTGLTSGTTYYYRVYSYGYYGASTYSNESNDTTTGGSTPTAPSGLSATAASATQINLAWTDNSSDETGFKIERKTGSGGTYAQIATPAANAVSYNDTGLTGNTTYYYRVRATNALGDSSYSSDANATTGETVYYIYPDQLGTPRLIQDQSGTTVWSWANDDPFGNNPPNENPSSLGTYVFNLRYPGQYRDSETSNYYNYFRDCYDPARGRYCQSDPIGLAGGINTYGYVGANPLSRLDPSGRVDQRLVDFAAGFGNVLLLGQGQRIRNLLGISGGINQCSSMYTAGEITGVALLVIGTAGAGTAAAGAAAETAMPTGEFYSVAFEARLSATSYPGLSRAAHIQEASETLLNAMESDAELASNMQRLGINIERTPTGLAPRQPPAGWTWHHAEERGVMQLVPRSQHAPGSIFQNSLHPGGRGGFSIWGQ